jgi:hypothetical protein
MYPLLSRILSPLFVLAVLCLAGCTGGKSGDSAEDVNVKFKIQPEPPEVDDPARVTLNLADKDGKPVKEAKLKLEGNMNHAGMKPVFADAKEVAPGKYEATLQLTMGGDWYVEVTGSLSDGRKLKRKFDVKGVKSR